MKVSINQPAFFPWLGYFHRIAISDLHIVLDHVQFEKNSFTNRNKIRTADGSLWITVPVVTSGKFGDLAIDKVEISPVQKWQKKTIETIKQFYRKAPYFNDYFPFLEEALSKDWVKLNDLIQYTNNYFLKMLEIDVPIIYSSKIETEGTKSDLVYNLCRKYNCTQYISGALGRNYLETTPFESNGIEIVFDDYAHPQYEQLYPGFVPYLSIIDLLFNHGQDSKKILMNY